ncbi:MAG TPA: polyprenol monophosphomannose synthase [Chitinispirillaceae bacterium]|jgi:dolichol-phosphate mannosyltransferase|nr:polyprenol monophosphomannose synthase [Chitinispirillaceae bacterium]
MKPGEALIIIPTYNERENIVLLIPEIKKVFPETDILVVDDNSPDGTGQCVKEIAGSINGVNLLERPGKEGLGKAYISGFKWALERGYQIVFEMDADFSHDPKYLPDFLAAIQENDLVIGSRYKSGVNVVNWPMTRLLLSYYSNQLARIVTGIPVRDSTGGFKCFRRSVIESLKLDKISSSGYSFQIEINYFAWKKGFRIAEIPIVFYDRKRGVSKMSTKIVREALILLWKLRLVSFFKKDC